MEHFLGGWQERRGSRHGAVQRRRGIVEQIRDRTRCDVYIMVAVDAGVEDMNGDRCDLFR